MEYFITQPSTSDKRLEISAEDYIQSVNAVNTTEALMQLERLFSIVAQSGIEIERYLLNLTLDEATSSGPESRKFIDDHDSANLLILSFFTSVRAYHDQRPQILSKALLTEFERSEVSAIYRKMFDASFEYRVMESLRNYAQHARLPLYALGHHWRDERRDGRIAGGAPSRLRYITMLVFDVAEIVEYGTKLNKNVLEEIRAVAQPKLDARYFLRVYLSELAECHEEVRMLTEGLKDKSFQRLRRITQVFMEAFPETPGTGLELLELAKIDGGVRISKLIGEGFYDTLDYARDRRRNLRDFKYMYISSQLKETKGHSTGSNRDIWIPK